MENAGIIEVICGPMFSGKTKALINRAKKELIDNQDILVFKPSVDNRYSEVNVVSHDRKKIECIVIKSSYEILNYIDKHLKNFTFASYLVNFFLESVSYNQNHKHNHNRIKN